MVSCMWSILGFWKSGCLVDVVLGLLKNRVYFCTDGAKLLNNRKTITHPWDWLLPNIINMICEAWMSQKKVSVSFYVGLLCCYC